MFINVNFTTIQININTIKNKDINIIFSNFGILSFLQVFNIIIPLVSVPYAVRIIGAEYFGLINFAAAFTGFFIIVSDYGFNLTANRDAAKNRNDSGKCNELYNSVQILKLFLLIVSSVLFIAFIFVFGNTFPDKSIFIISLGTLAGTALFPQWLFKGLEKMYYIAVPGIVIRSFATALVFVLVKEKADYIIYALLLNGSIFVLGLTGITIVRFKLKYRYFMPSFEILKRNFKEGLEVFYSIICTSIYNYANTFILGLFYDFRIVGLYSAADKIISGIVGLVSNLNESTYPRISALLAEEKEKGIGMIKTSSKLIGAVSLFFSLFIIIFAEPVVSIIFGSEFSGAVPLLRIMSLIPPFISLNNLLGVQTMLNLGHKKEFLVTVFVSLLFFLALSFVIVPLLGAAGTALAITSTEFLVLLIMFIFVKRKNLLA